MSSPVASLLGSIQKKTSGGEFSIFFNDERRKEMLHGIFNSYYYDIPNDSVIFDTNRTWTGRTSLLSLLYPDSRIICCVRDIGWIIDSIEKMLHKNPLQLSRMFNFEPGASVYSRIESLMNSDTGQVGLAWSNLREAWYGPQSARLILVPYDHLTKDPKRTIEYLYKELNEPIFQHDFNNIIYDEPDYDSHIGMPGLHKVREKVEYIERVPCIPPDIFSKYASANFWLNPNLNSKKVKII